MSLLEITLLAVTGFAAGLVNAVAGGGTFFTFAAMVGFGMPTLNANATSAVALVPGSLASTVAYAKETRKNWRRAVPFVLLGLFGGIAGGYLLIRIGDEGFRPMVPWLIGIATLTFAFGARIRAFSAGLEGRHSAAMRAAAFALMGLVGIYGGFFGAGMGIMLLATLSIIGISEFHTANALKNIVATLSQAVAVVLFVANGLVFWREAAIVTAAGIAGGYLGVMAARRVPEPVVRGIVVAVGAALTVVFFFRG
ncbi:MAG TPA: sulfite exporter TauE/SafE family protein [Pseudolabrys sp.]|nr:sulfite exporter TauE/SafE family protein [Pseudolabrys sp.]